MKYWQPPQEVTRELYDEWRNPRRGKVHAEKMNNPVWRWLARTRISAYRAMKYFDAPSPFEAGLGWSCDRLGQSCCDLPDGRMIVIAGEHEEHFTYIYNDVIVLHPHGAIDIFGYPEADFPPTDFHTATLLGKRIILVGNLDYSRTRQPAHTPVFALDHQSMKIEPIPATGDNPGSIYRHTATLQGSDLLIRGGYLLDDEDTKENIEDWKLNLETWVWSRLTDRRWVRVEVYRNDKERLHLSEARTIRFKVEENIYEYYRSHSDLYGFKSDIARLTENLGASPDLAMLDTLYRPPIDHEALPEEDFEHCIYRLRTEGVIVRYVEGYESITMTVEGHLPQSTIDILAADLLQKLSCFENTKCGHRSY